MKINFPDPFYHPRYVVELYLDDWKPVAWFICYQDAIEYQAHMSALSPRDVYQARPMAIDYSQLPVPDDAPQPDAHLESAYDDRTEI